MHFAGRSRYFDKSWCILVSARAMSQRGGVMVVAKRSNGFLERSALQCVTMAIDDYTRSCPTLVTSI